MKIIRIESCGYYQHKFWDGDLRTCKCSKIKGHLTIDNLKTISPWCPLDDMPESLFKLWLDASKERKKNDL